MKTENLEDIYQLTPLQQGILFDSLYTPDAGVYIEQLRFTLRGTVNLVAFQRAWQMVVDRHPILRSAFYWQNLDKPLQTVLRQVELPVEQIDWRELSEVEQEQRIEEYLLNDRRQGFDFSRPPLMRLTLFHLRDDTYLFAWRFTHLIMDGWSFSLAIQEFVMHYKTIYHSSNLQVLPGSRFRDYVAWWQRQNLSPSVQQFWQEYLRGFSFSVPLNIESEGKYLPEGEATHRWEELRLSKIAGKLQGFAREHKLTLNTLLQSSWMLLLSRYSGEEDIVAGTTIAHRPSSIAQVESMIGLMIITLPIRAQFDLHAPLIPWLQDFQQQQARVREQGGATLTQIQRWSGISSSTPLFESTISFENIPLPTLTLREEDLEVSDVFYDGRPKYPLTLVVLPGDDMPLRLIYDHRRFEATVIRGMLLHLSTLLESLIANPDQRLGDIDILTKQEKHLLLEEWNHTKEYSSDRCLPELFEERASLSPNAPAITFEDQKLTYRELNERANQLAHYLRKLSVRPEQCVAIFMERSLEMIIGVLGVLKAGGVYVPMDPLYPKERLAFMLADTEVPVIITQQGLLDHLPEHTATVICWPEDNEEIAREIQTNPDHVNTVDQLAYVIYTSGSTGKPKGVCISHGNVARLFSATNHLYSFGPEDTWVLFHSLAFDVSVWEIWGALLFGGHLVVLSYWDTRSPQTLVELLNQHQVTILNQTPSAFRPLLQVEQEQEKKGFPPSLRLINFAGEALNPHLLQSWFARYGDEHPRLVNAYGTTETTVHATYYEVKEKDAFHYNRSPIGRPFPDLKFYVFNKQMLLAPIGVIGELYIGGAGVARGYLKRPELTQERFIQNPYSNSSQTEILYKTGDLVRYQSDGSLLYLGRSDDQVKIRGFRIELSEIESTLCAHPSIAAAALIAYEEGTGDKKLIAYIVGEEIAECISELRNWLREKLPEYMIPQTFIHIDVIPITNNGKLDRRALMNLKDTGVEKHDGGIPPRTLTEYNLVEIFTKVLSTETIGVQDNLFDIGFHSLLATRAVAQIRDVLKVDVPLRALFEMPTIETIAKAIDEDTLGKRFAIDLLAEAQLDPDIQITPQWEWEPQPKHIFLTGATGFLGAFLLADLLQITSARVSCLVRAISFEEGKRKLKEKLKSYGIWNDSFEGRIIPVIGDLAQKQLGLNAQEFSNLAGTVDEIYHSGAEVNFLYSYHRLKASNVRGLQEVLHLACTTRAKPLHYVSTVGVYSRSHQENPIMEKDLPENSKELSSGYAQTKWVAEHLCLAARQRGLPIAIYRPGRITGQSKSGVWGNYDIVCQVIKACVCLGMIPNIEMTFDMVPVDFVSSAIALIARKSEALGTNFHLTNLHPVEFFRVKNALTQKGYTFQLVSIEEWYKGLLDMVQKSPDEELSTLLPIVTPWLEEIQKKGGEPQFDCSKTSAFLDGELTCPRVEEEQLQKYLSFLMTQGYLPAPPNVEVR